MGWVKWRSLSSSQWFTLLMFTILFGINIAFGNLSLHIVDIPFSQVVRATSPLWNALLTTVLLNEYTPLSIWASLVPVVMGVICMAYGDFTFSYLSLVVIIIGIIIANLKSIASNKYIKGFQLHPIQFLAIVCPMGFLVLLIISFFNGEWDTFISTTLPEMKASDWVFCVFTGLTAFSLNIANIIALVSTSPLTLSVVGNLKQITTIGLSFVLFDQQPTLTQLTGIGLAIIGLFAYTFVKHTINEKRLKEKTA
mmetsp:Transcript_3945/g.5830  ORF Transcript_3945/g.5830 Transcript_3945/m.5830 type:complete len:253 (-) Transcript_3945:51-809(-)